MVPSYPPVAEKIRSGSLQKQTSKIELQHRDVNVSVAQRVCAESIRIPKSNVTHHHCFIVFTTTATDTTCTCIRWRLASRKALIWSFTDLSTSWCMSLLNMNSMSSPTPHSYKSIMPYITPKLTTTTEKHKEDRYQSLYAICTMH